MNEGDAKRADGGDNGRETETPRRLWRVADVAAHARCCPRTVGNLMLAGMPFIKLGHLVRFEPEAVVAWMRGGRR